MAAEPEPSLAKEVLDLCASIAPRRPPTVTADSTLAQLGYDSLACADLGIALEERFGAGLADADITGIRTVADVAAVVDQTVAARERIPAGLGRMQAWAKRTLGPAFGWQSRLTVQGAENVPRSGAAIIAANHRSFLDIPLLVIASPRPIVFMAKEELFRSGLGWVWHQAGGFPVRRQVADVRAIDTGLAMLERGDVLGLYPEGTRSRKGEMLPFLAGAAWMALRVGAPIVPCGIRGTDRPPGSRRAFRKRVRVAFGPAIPIVREADTTARRRMADSLTGQLLEQITQLLQ